MIAPNEQTGGKGGAHRAAGSTDGDFKNLVDLLAIYSEAENRLEELQAEANQEYLQTVDSRKKEYADLQAKMIETEKAIEILVRRHPEWLKEKKTLKTPYGSTSLKDNPPKLVVKNPELSIVLIEREAEMDPTFNAGHYLRKVTELNLETLAGLPDEKLKKFRIDREQSDTFSVKAAKLDMGKAVKESTTKESK